MQAPSERRKMKFWAIYFVNVETCLEVRSACFPIVISLMARFPAHSRLGSVNAVTIIELFLGIKYAGNAAAYI